MTVANAESLEVFFEASIDHIGPEATITTKFNDNKQKDHAEANDSIQAIDALLNAALAVTDFASIAAVGHRIVHGGGHSETAAVVDDALIADLESFADFDPEHAPAALSIIEHLKTKLPDALQVTCFDTAFFHDIPTVAQITSLPREYRELGLRRYGFHGLSYTYLLEQIRAKYGDDEANKKIIFAHLGSGSSLASVSGGKAVDMTMSFTPTAGVVMSSRSGDVDPGVVGFLAHHTGMTVDEWTNITNKKSGLLGVSGITADMKTLLDREAEGSVEASEAVELFIYSIQKAIGALAATMNGVDRLVFAGGIGEQSFILRRRICEDLGFLGIEIDGEANDAQAEVISTSNSRIPVNVIPTNENFVILKRVQALIEQ